MSDLNDPRVLFAAERTLLAWNRTSLTVMAFGFVIERFGLFMRMLTQGNLPGGGLSAERGPSFWVGLIFIFLGAVIALLSTIQYRRVLTTLRPVEIPEGYWIKLAMWTNLAVAALGITLILFLFD